MVVKLDIGNDTVVSAMCNADNINTEINNVHSTFLNVVNFEGEVHNVVSRLILC